MYKELTTIKLLKHCWYVEEQLRKMGMPDNAEIIRELISRHRRIVGIGKRRSRP